MSAEETKSTILDLIDDKVKNTNVTNLVVDKLADLEIQKRVETLIKAVGTSKVLKAELQKIDRDDLTAYEGGIKKTSMSENRYKEIKSLKEKIDQFQAAFNKVLETNDPEDYKKLTDKIAQASSKATGAEVADLVEKHK